MNKIQDVIDELKRISETQSTKTVTMWIQPMDEGWSYEFDFSAEEMDLANELTGELDFLMNFRVSFPTFPYEPKE